ncbi:GATOR complex protein NPRL2 isoform X1 [Schistocerca americana]|uniref:GATOR complex protein NPRL2 isoform X1 n=1 Tax=Schistocerca americana TaxID=7009 RepID=UPI001F4F8137|nr:GATOR complex protein NPRL2 isoform X1 [Schistocerca americana]
MGAVNGGDERYFEGCGREGPVRCIFFSEFHPTAGPKITCQVPEDYVSKEVFDAVNVYIIPKPQLQRSILTINTFGYKITGFPVRIDDAKYARNAYYFNLCFVCDAWARTVQYEPVVKKLSEYLLTMEEEGCFLSQVSSETTKHHQLFSILKQILNNLNATGMSTVREGEMTMFLKVVRAATDPPPVMDHHVPIFTTEKGVFQEEQWDLTTQQLLPHVDGFKHIAQIAVDADVENSLVKACIQNLLYYKAVSLLPIFLYSNVYTPTPKVRLLATDAALQEECIKYVSLSGQQLPSVQEIFVMYCSMTHGTTLQDLCSRYNPQEHNIDERKLVQFGLLHKLIRRICKYPVYIKSTNHCQPVTSLQHSFTGLLSYDEVCCTRGYSPKTLEEKVESDPSVVVIWK